MSRVGFMEPVIPRATAAKFGHVANPKNLRHAWNF
jgi:hypothetical protein